MRRAGLASVFVVVLSAGQTSLSAPQPMGTAFTYQGRLMDGNQAADGRYDFRFMLFDGPTDGNQVGITIDANNVDVIDGYFTVELDFVGSDPNVSILGGAGSDRVDAIWGVGHGRWLEIGVRPAYRFMSGPEPDPTPLAYTSLSPRQKITPTPYALYAMSGGGGAADSDWIIAGNDMYSGVPGNVGIGTTSPTAKLQVTGTTLVSNGGIETIFGTAGTPGYRFMGTGVNTGMFAPASNELAFSTNSAERMRVNSAGNVGIATTNPAYPLDIAGAMNLNKGKTGIALTVNDSEALWYNGDYFSWGYGGSRNYFANPVGIGPGTTDPAERLDVSWSGGVNARIGRYNYLGSCFSSANLVLGNNVRARTDSVNGIVVGNTHDYYGYRAIGMSMEGITFYGVTGKVTAGDPMTNERMRITNDGKVGIGTTSPQGRLHVKCGALAADGIIIEGTLYPALKLHNGTAAKGFLFWDHLNGGVLNLNTDGISGNGLMIRNNSVGIGTLNPGAYKFYVAGTAYATGGWQSSDLRFKQNIKTIDSPIDKVMNVKGVSFEWKTSEYKDKGFPEGRHYGVIAQEVERALPEIVMEGPGGEKAVSYTELVPVLIEAIKQQQKEIISLKEALAQNESLNQRLDALEKKIEDIERYNSSVVREVQQ